MGRIFEKRKDRMFARWSKTAKAFTKLGKELAISVKLGGIDPHSNPRLRMAIQSARALNMPKDRIEAAIKRASSKDETAFEESIYEAYGQHGVALLIECATDNGTRTVANVRSILGRYGGTLATSGALAYVFARKGVFKIAAVKGDQDDFELELIDHGLEEIFETDDGLLLYSDFAHYSEMYKAIEARGVEVQMASTPYVPATMVPQLPEEQEKDVMTLIEKLEEDDDVQHVYHNLELAE